MYKLYLYIISDIVGLEFPIYINYSAADGKFEKEPSEYDKLTAHIKDLCRLDPIHTSFVDITGLGIMELIRNKNDKSLKEILQDVENSVDI